MRKSIGCGKLVGDECAADDDVGRHIVCDVPVCATKVSTITGHRLFGHLARLSLLFVFVHVRS